MVELTEKQKELKSKFVENRGYWSECWEEVLELDSEFFASYFRFSSILEKIMPYHQK